MVDTVRDVWRNVKGLGVDADDATCLVSVTVAVDGSEEPTSGSESIEYGVGESFSEHGVRSIAERIRSLMGILSEFRSPICLRKRWLYLEARL
jgi:hypothetical protein